MEIKLQEISIRDLVAGYENLGENGVCAYNGKLDIRPPYQREFIYKTEQQQAVIKTILKKYPLNSMYWATRDDGRFELIDGQQRTLSICEYVTGNFSMYFDGEKRPQYFLNLPLDMQNDILNYKLIVYICTGSQSEKFDWFRIINIAGERLTEQEIRNAVYAGSFVTEAKKKFSKSTCVAYKLGKDYMSGSPIRQEYLETAIAWINEGSYAHDKVSENMAIHQHDENADDLWSYYKKVIYWIEENFSKKRREMKFVPWGEIYNLYKDMEFSSRELEENVSRLMNDEDVQNKPGIYSYVFDHDERHLNLRTFDDNMKHEVYETQNGYCMLCNEYFKIEEMDIIQIVPWSQGGRTTIENCQILCKKCNGGSFDKD